MSRTAQLATLAVALLLAACGGTAAESPGPADDETLAETSQNDRGVDSASEESGDTPAETAAQFEDLVAEVKTGVVRIQVETCEGSQEGTGIIVGPRLVATVEHVVDGAVTVDLRQRGRSVGTGTVIGYDVERDVALIRSDRPLDGHEFVFSSRAARLGEDVAAIGFPLGLPLTVTRGLVSGLWRTIEIEGVTRRRLVQTDAAVNPGNSGGPLLSVRSGDVIGLVSAGSLEANAIAFAVPARTVSQLIGAWKSSPQPVEAPSCGGGEPPTETPSRGGGGGSYSGYFTSYDRLESCIADDSGAACVALPSGKGVSLEVGFGAVYEGMIGDASDAGGPELELGDSFTTPGGQVTCESSNRGVTCVDNTTGWYFVIGDYTVKTNNGGGEEGY